MAKYFFLLHSLIFFGTIYNILYYLLFYYLGRKEIYSKPSHFIKSYFICTSLYARA